MMTSLPAADPGLAAGTRAAALVVACLVLPIVVLHASFIEMAGIWHTSGTFTHGFLVLPLFLYLMWERRGALAHLPVKPFLPGLAVAAALGFVWFVGELASARTPSFFAAVAAIPIAIGSILGLAWMRALAFPLAMLFFAVPFGEVFVPVMIEWTADFTVAALRLSGVPVLRQGQNFVIPTGHWSVVDACSGIRYLIASLFAGLLFAWLMFRSPRRRAIFVAVAVLVPIVANWLRAYGIVMLGHLSDNRIATGVDHVLYGWVFFGIVMGLMFMIGARWRENELPADAVVAGRSPAAAVESGWRRPLIAAAAFVLCLAVWEGLADRLSTPAAAGSAPAVMIQPAAGWLPESRSFTDWRPLLTAPTGEQTFTFRRGDQVVSVHFGLYRNQRQGAELVNATNRLLPPEQSDKVVAEGRRVVALGGRPVEIPSARLQPAGDPLLVWHWYWLGSVITASDSRAKVDLALDRLRGHDDTSAWVAVYTRAGDDDAAAVKTLETFVVDMAGPIDAALRRAAAEWK